MALSQSYLEWKEATKREGLQQGLQQGQRQIMVLRYLVWFNRVT